MGGREKSATVKTGNDALYVEIGRLKVELDWLKKKWECSIGGEPFGFVLPAGGGKRSCD